MVVNKYNELSSVKAGLATGIVIAIVVFLTTLSGLYGSSRAAEFMALTFWGSLGYSVSWAGAFVGLIIGFVYAFIGAFVIIYLYNKLIK